MTAAEQRRRDLLYGILCDPFDLDRRSVYADYLDESGQDSARAEFIRCQLALLDAPKPYRKRVVEIDGRGDMKWSDGWGYPPGSRADVLDRRQAALLTEHGGRWLEGLPHEGIDVWLTWRAGFVALAVVHCHTTASVTPLEWLIQHEPLLVYVYNRRVYSEESLNERRLLYGLPPLPRGRARQELIRLSVFDPASDVRPGAVNVHA